MGPAQNSPFKKIFSKAMNGKVSIGPVSVEQIQLPQEVETNFELVLLIDEFSSTTAVSLIANAESYDQDDLIWIAQGIRSRLRQCSGQT